VFSGDKEYNRVF
jgi:hypothetical protein